MKTIQLFAPTFEIDECLEEIRKCLELGWTGIGFKTNEFETEFGKYINSKLCHFVNSNTNGIHLLLEVLKRKYNWKNGDEVITSPLTFVSANHSILHSGLSPIFADIDDSLCMTPESIQSKITSNTKAVMYVCIGGNASHLLAVKRLCKEHGLKFILDAAHSAGSRLNNKHLSELSDYSIYSFQAVKNLPSADSGMVVFQTAEEDELARQLSWCGINKDTYSRSKDGYKWLYDVNEVGFKYHGNSIMASIALVQLKYLDRDNAVRRNINESYKSKLHPTAHFDFIKHSNESESSRHLIQLTCERRDELIEYLSANGIGTGVHYVPNNKYPMYKHMPTPYAQAKYLKIISLPNHLRLEEDDIIYITDHIKKFYK